MLRAPPGEGGRDRLVPSGGREAERPFGAGGVHLEGLGELIGDGTHLAEALEAGRTPAEAWLAVGRAFRRYALEHRSSFELVFGTPVPGYAAPPETVAAAARLWFVIARVCAAAAARGELDPVGPPPVKDLMDPEVLAMAREHLGEEVALDDALVARAVTLWVSLVGTTCAEVFGHLRGMTHDHPALFELTLATAAVGVGLRLPAS